MVFKRYKNISLLVLLVILSLLAYWLVSGEKDDKQLVQETFSLPTGLSPDKISFESKGNHKQQTLEQVNQEWYLNKTIKTKANLSEALLSILHRVEAKRGIAKKQESTLQSLMDSAAVLVKTYKEGELLNAFEIWGDGENKTTYIRQPDDNRIYIAHIPGYNTYLAALFFLGEDQWRSNVLFESTPRSLRKLTIEYPAEKDKGFTIQYHNDFFTVAGVAKLDTVALLNYLEDFSQITVDGYAFEEEEMEKVMQQGPELIVHIDDIDPSKSNIYSFYFSNGKDRGEVGVIGKEKQWGKLSRAHFDQIARTEDYFSVEEHKK